MTLDNHKACITLISNGTKNYQFDFPFNVLSDIVVETRIDNTSDFHKITNYTIDPIQSAINNPSQIYLGGTVKLDQNLPAQQEIRISRVVSVDQPYTFANTISAPSKETEHALDYLSMVDQQQQCQINDMDARLVTAVQAQAAATSAANSASQAQTYAQSALLAKTAAETSSNNAAQSATNAANSANSITGAVTQAQTAATNAAQSATDANTAFHGAQGILTSVITQSTAATNAATNAQTAATNAATSATNAAHSETLIAQHMVDAQTASHNAQQAATNAQGSATQALASANRIPDPATGHQDDVITIDNGHYVLKQGGTGGGGGGGGAFIPNPATGNTGDMVVVSGTGSAKTYGLQANPASPATIDVLKLSKSSGIINGCHLTVNLDLHSFKISAGNVLYVSPEAGIPVTVKTYAVAANDNIQFAPTLLPVAKVIYIYVEVDLTTQATNIVQRNALEKKARGELIFIGFAMNPLLGDVGDIVNVNNVVSSCDFNQFSELVFNGAYTTGYALEAANATHFKSHDCAFYGAVSSRTLDYLTVHGELEHNNYTQTIINGASPQLFQFIANAKLPGQTPRPNLIAPYGMEPGGTGTVIEIPSNHFFYFLCFVAPSGMLYLLLPFESFDTLDKVPAINDYYYKWQSHFPEPLKTFYAPVSAILMKQGLSLIDPDIKFLSLEKYSGFEYAGSLGGSSGLSIQDSLNSGFLYKAGSNIISKTIEGLASDLSNKLPHNVSENFLESNEDDYHDDWDKVLSRGIALPIDDTQADGTQSGVTTKYLHLSDFVSSYDDISNLFFHSDQSARIIINTIQQNGDNKLKYALLKDVGDYPLVYANDIIHNSSSNPITINFIRDNFGLSRSRMLFLLLLDSPINPNLTTIGRLFLDVEFIIRQGESCDVHIGVTSDTQITKQTSYTFSSNSRLNTDINFEFSSANNSFFHDESSFKSSYKYVYVEFVTTTRIGLNFIIGNSFLTLNPKLSSQNISLPTDHVKFLFPYKISEYNTSSTTGNLVKGLNKTNVSTGDIYIILRYSRQDKTKSPIRGVVKVPGDSGSKYPIVKLETVDKLTSAQTTLVVARPRYCIYKATLTQNLMDYRVSVRFVKPADGYLGEGVVDFKPATILQRHILKCGILMVTSIPNH
ncbi:MAG: hypothetical protein ACRCX2_01170 [Paraclostridium sp.]